MANFFAKFGVLNDFECFPKDFFLIFQQFSQKNSEELK